MTTPINATSLNQLNVDLNGVYDQILTNLKDPLADITTQLSTNYPTYKFHWMEAVQQLKVYFAQRSIQSVGLQSMNVDMNDFQLTLGIPRNAILYDNLQLYMNKTAQLARQVALHPSQRIALRLKNGHLTTPLADGTPGLVGFDGAATFATNHDYDPSKASGQSNYFTSTDLNEANFAAALIAMSSFTGPDGQVIGASAKTLLVPSALEWVAKKIVETPLGAYIGSGGGTAGNNVYYNSVKVLVVPQLNGSVAENKTWYLVDDDLMPINYITSIPPSFTSFTNPDDYHVWKNKEFAYSADRSGEACLGAWFGLIKNVGT